ncbi:MAG: DUF2339 domain-containing protein [Alphaproteobacteria bacterium]|nr:DUF2339 domain-containing protein [Alphaproteobacteria bacterium]
MELFYLVGLALVLYFLVAPALGLVAFNRTSRLERQVVVLRQELGALRAGAAPSPEPVPAAAPMPVPAAVPMPETMPEPQPSAEAVVETEAVRPVPPAGGQPKRPWEERLTGRGLVWLGGATLALGGAFLVKYSIDHGFIGPLARVVLGLLFGLALVAFGEWLRQRPSERRLAAWRADQIPQAVAGAGFFTLFASVYTAYALYGLVSAGAAFGALALVAYGAVLFALAQGPFLALLGIVAGYATPFLVAASEPSALALFAYLATLVAAGLAIVTYRGWWWLGWVTLTGGGLVPLLWLGAGWRAGDDVVLGVFLVLLAGLFVAARLRFPPAAPADTALFDFAGMAAADRLALGAVLIALLDVFVLVRVADYAPAAVLALAAIAGLGLLLGRRAAALEVGALAVAATVLLALATWHIAHLVGVPTREMLLDAGNGAGVRDPVIAPAAQEFCFVAGGFALAFAGLGFALLWGARRPWLWAGLGVGMPTAILALAYDKIADFTPDLRWAAVALLLAGLALFGAERTQRHRAAAGLTGAVASYAAGVSAALALALTMALRDAWLSVALSLQLPALAWIEARLVVPRLRWLALAVAAVVLARLLANPFALDYALSVRPFLNWLSYGYGVPALAFWWAARGFRVAADDATVAVLEAGALAFAVMLVSLEIRHIVHDGRVDHWNYEFAERAMHAFAWLVSGAALLAREQARQRRVLRWGALLLIGLATASILLGQLLIGSPLLWTSTIGKWPLLNWLLPGYLLPGILYLYLSRLADRLGRPLLARTVGGLGLFLLFWTLTMEVRLAFHGPYLSGALTSDSEWYAYSAAWLLFGGALLALGLWRGESALRWASLAVVQLTVAKVFLYDMSALTGLLRAFSFIGLGAALLGIGFLYQRLVFPPKPSAPT